MVPSALVAIVVLAISWPWVDARAADELKVVIVRHAEKPKSGDNLSCQGENRALQLPAVLLKKFNKPDYTYVPALGLGNASKHARMFQTVTPFAIKHNLTVNSKFSESDVFGVSKDVLTRSGVVLLVWEHSEIPPLAKALGVSQPPPWKGDDFDSIWVITYTSGHASLTSDSQGITPSPQCSY